MYNLTERNLLPFYKYVVENTSMRVLIYNGDTDPCINSFVTQNWTSSLNFPVLQPWRPYTIDNASYMGGYVTRYKVNIRGIWVFRNASVLCRVLSSLNLGYDEICGYGNST